jgi:branched-chain amino acid transport system ATP-binding protein/sulfate-transporting ATPase
MSGPLLQATGLVRKFGGVVALDHLDLKVMPDEIVGLIGPNGSGKTTFFNVVTGIYGADEGGIAFDGADITRASSRRTTTPSRIRSFWFPSCSWAASAIRGD